MSHKKNRPTQTIQDITEELSNLARDLAAGKLHVGSKMVTIGAPLSFKLKQKLKDNTLSYDISFQLPLKGKNTLTDRDKKSPEHGSDNINQEKLIPKTFSPGAKQTKDKKPKKEIARLWKNILQKINEEQEISANDANQLINLCSMEMYQDKPWHDDWIACCHTVGKCIEAARSGNYEKAKQLVPEVKRQTSSCHKQYK